MSFRSVSRPQRLKLQSIILLLLPSGPLKKAAQLQTSASYSAAGPEDLLYDLRIPPKQRALPAMATCCPACGDYPSSWLRRQHVGASAGGQSEGS